MSWMMLAGLLVAAVDPVALEPAGKWRLDAGAQSCLLMRTFGSAPSDVTLVLHPRPGMPRIDVISLHAADAAKPNAEQPATVTVLPSGEHFDGKADTAIVGDGRARDTASVPVKIIDTLPAATHLTLSIAGGPSMSYHLGTAASAITALKACEDDLLRSWGVDPARFRPMVEPGQSGYVDVLKYMKDDYPAAALHVSGRTIALLTIAETGKVSACRTVESAGHPALDAKTCEIGKRIRYPPAQDAGGAPVNSWTVLPMRWISRG